MFWNSIIPYETLANLLRLTAGMLREVKRDVVLSNGVVLPAGRLVIVENDVASDLTINPQPEKFDAHRNLHLRQQPNGETQRHFLITSPHDLVFGYGSHQCPGTIFTNPSICNY